MDLGSFSTKADVNIGAKPQLSSIQEIMYVIGI